MSKKWNIRISLLVALIGLLTVTIDLISKKEAPLFQLCKNISKALLSQISLPLYLLILLISGFGLLIFALIRSCRKILRLKQIIESEKLPPRRRPFENWLRR